MIFKKDVAKIALHLKKGYATEDRPYGVIEGEASGYDFDVDKCVNIIKDCIQKDKMILLDGDTIGTSGGIVDYFEIINYDELLALKEERNRDTK